MIFVVDIVQYPQIIWGHTIEEAFIEKRREYDKRREKCFFSIDHIYILNNKTLDTFKPGYKTMHERRKPEKMLTLWGNHGLQDLQIPETRIGGL